jgi:hypothetical protein
VTEQEWLACADPTPMLEFLRGKASERKLRLFSCASVRRYWGMFQDNRSDRAIEITENYADSRKRQYPWRRFIQRWQEEASPIIVELFDLDAFLSAKTISVLEMESARRPHAQSSGGEAAERGKQIAFLRDLFGNPFRPVSFDAAWQTPTVVALAQVPYKERALPSGELDTVRLAVLADALEEAGCNNPDILDHLRGPGPHVRGCWPVDLLTGRS